MIGIASLIKNIQDWRNTPDRPPVVKSVRSAKPKIHVCPASSVNILVIDVSGSMGMGDYKPSRLDGAKTASKHFLTRLLEVESSASVGLVKFGSWAKVVSHPLPVRADVMTLESRIESLSISGATNIGDGLKKAGSEITRIQNYKYPRILLLTDGDSTDGPDPVGVAKRLKAQGIQIDIIGIGGSRNEVNEKDLKQMASVINGELRYWFIESVPELVKKFETLAIREIRK